MCSRRCGTAKAERGRHHRQAGLKQVTDTGAIRPHDRRGSGTTRNRWRNSAPAGEAATPWSAVVMKETRETMALPCPVNNAATEEEAGAGSGATANGGFHDSQLPRRTATCRPTSVSRSRARRGLTDHHRDGAGGSPSRVAACVFLDPAPSAHSPVAELRIATRSARSTSSPIRKATQGEIRLENTHPSSASCGDATGSSPTTAT